MSPGDQIPAWYYDASTGLWQEDGAGTVQFTGSQLEWVASVSHLGWWNAQRPWADTNCVLVTVTLGDGTTPIAGASVRARGSTYNGQTTSVTGADGRACVELQRGGDVEITVDHPSFPVHFDDPFIINGDASSAAACSDAADACQEITLRLGGRTCLSGTVLNVDGQPAGGAQVYASFTDSTGNQSSYAAQAGSDGTFCLDAPKGACIDVFAFDSDGTAPLRARTSACDASASEQVCSAGSQCNDVGSLQLASAATHTCVRGRVFASHVAASDAPVLIYANSPRMMCSNPPAATDDPAYWGSVVAQGTTGPDGSFCVDIPVAPTNSDSSPFSLPRAVLPADCVIRRRDFFNSQDAVTLFLNPFDADRSCAASQECIDIGNYEIFFSGS